MAEAERTEYEQEWRQRIEQLTPAFAALDKPWQIALACQLIDADFAKYAGELGFDDETRELFYVEGLEDLAQAPELRTRMGLPAEATVEAIEEKLKLLFGDALVRPNLKQDWLVALIQGEE